MHMYEHLPQHAQRQGRERSTLPVARGTEPGTQTLLPHVQDASIKAFRPGSEVVGGPGVAAMNGHASGTLRLAQEALPDVCSSKEDAHCGAVQTLALCGNHLCSAGGDAMIRIWDASTLAFLRCACHDFSLLSPSVFYLSSCHWR